MSCECILYYVLALVSPLLPSFDESAVFRVTAPDHTTAFCEVFRTEEHVCSTPRIECFEHVDWTFMPIRIEIETIFVARLPLPQDIDHDGAQATAIRRAWQLTIPALAAAPIWVLV